MERMFERFALARACDCGRIFDAPVRGHRLAGPCRACLAGRIVTDGEDEVEAGGAGLREFVPALRTQILRPEAEFVEQGERLRMDVGLGAAAGPDSRKRPEERRV